MPPHGEDLCSESVQTETQPFIIDFSGDERIAFSLAMSRGLAIVAQDCDGLRVLPDCSYSGEYVYTGTSPQKDITKIDNWHDVSLRLPITGAKAAPALRASIEGEKSLYIGTVIVGEYRTSVREVDRITLKGASGACDGATHFVRSATIGAAKTSVGSYRQGEAEIALFSARAGGTRGASELAVREAGDLAACLSSTRGTPVEGCDVPVHVSLWPLSQDEGVAHERCTAISVLPHYDENSEVYATLRESSCETRCALGDVVACQSAIWQLGLAEKSAFSEGELQRIGKEIFKISRQGCRQGDLASCHSLASVYYDEDSMMRDVGMAYDLFERACFGGLDASCAVLGSMHMLGEGVEENEERGLELFELACHGGEHHACLTAGQLLDGQYMDASIVPDKARARDFFSKGCRGKNENACYEVALSLLHAGGANAKQAISVLSESCDRGVVGNCRALSAVLIEGSDGVDVDRERGLSILENLCTKQDKGSICRDLGYIYETGKWAKKDLNRAAEYYHRAGVWYYRGGLLTGIGLEGRDLSQELFRDAYEAWSKACTYGKDAACEEAKKAASEVQVRNSNPDTNGPLEP